MEIEYTPGGGSKRRPQSVLSSKAGGESCRRMLKLRGFLFLVTCFLLLAVVFMAVDQFSHLPRYTATDGAASREQSHKQNYNHGANRGPHLGQKPRSTYDDIQHKSRKLVSQADSSSLYDSSVNIRPLFNEQYASHSGSLD